MASTHLTGAIRLPDGCWVRGRGLRDPRPEGIPPDHGLYLGTDRLRDRYDAGLRWSHEWLDWPDFWLPRDRERAIERIVALHGRVRAQDRVEVACKGGVGRTGTVIACLAILSGLPATEAVAWTRANYHHRAIETPWQRIWVRRFPPAVG